MKIKKKKKKEHQNTSNALSVSFVPQFLSYFWNYVAQFFAELRKYISSGSNATIPEIDPATKQKMIEFQQYVAKPFDIEDPVHHEHLVKLWNMFFDDTTFTLQSPDWKKLGFQSENPLSDFRASGFFCLKNLIFFSEKYTKKFKYLLDINESRPGAYYPFAIASFNVTMMLCELLGWGWKKPGVSTAKDPVVYSRMVSMLFKNDVSMEFTENVFSELYCLVMVEMDNEWEESKATYMDFPVVITNSQQRLEKLIRGFSGVEDLISYNQKVLKEES